MIFELQITLGNLLVLGTVLFTVLAGRYALRSMNRSIQRIEGRLDLLLSCAGVSDEERRRLG